MPSVQRGSVKRRGEDLASPLLRRERPGLRPRRVPHERGSLGVARPEGRRGLRASTRRPHPHPRPAADRRRAPRPVPREARPHPRLADRAEDDRPVPQGTRRVRHAPPGQPAPNRSRGLAGSTPARLASRRLPRVSAGDHLGRRPWPRRAQRDRRDQESAAQPARAARGHAVRVVGRGRRGSPRSSTPATRRSRSSLSAPAYAPRSGSASTAPTSTERPGRSASAGGSSAASSRTAARHPAAFALCRFVSASWTPSTRCRRGSTPRSSSPLHAAATSTWRSSATASGRPPYAPPGSSIAASTTAATRSPPGRSNPATSNFGTRDDHGHVGDAARGHLRALAEQDRRQAPSGVRRLRREGGSKRLNAYVLPVSRGGSALSSAIRASARPLENRSALWAASASSLSRRLSRARSTSTTSEPHVKATATRTTSRGENPDASSSSPMTCRSWFN